jgi:SAM-dependent methyltransferase
VGVDEPAEALVDRGWRELARIDAMLARGEIDEEGWHRAVAQVVVPAYLAGASPRAQSGSSADEAGWEQARRPLLQAVDRGGTFLDIGCANGHLMECLQRWAGVDGLALEVYGLEISPELADLARRRLPQWRARIWTGNAYDFEPPTSFDFVRTGLDYVPPSRRQEFVRRLLTGYLNPRGRLIIGMHTELRGETPIEQVVCESGNAIAGRLEIAHQDPRAVRRAFWIDRES